jgi:PAS domain S-box-containing protein
MAFYSVSEKKRNDRQTAVWIAFGYFAAAGLWILTSDRLVSALFRDPDHQLALQHVKGIGFVVVTAVILYGLILRELRARSAGESASRMLSMVLRNSSDAIFVLDLEGRVVAWNHGAERTYGWTEQEAEGLDVRRLLVEEGQTEIEELLARIRGGEALVTYPTRRRARDGRLVDVWLTATRVTDDAGRPTAVALTEHDVTSELAASREVLRLNAELEERVRLRTRQLETANQELESFSYSVSHDLRAPLRAIDGFSRALLEDCAGQLDATGRNYLDRIGRACERMARLIDDLLELSRTTRAPINLGTVDVSRLAEQVVAELRAAEPDRAVEIRIARDLSARADPVLLRVVVQNLVGNAWKFTRNQAAPEIEVGMEEGADGQQIFFVRDNGAGFDMQYAGKLFGPFQRLHSENEFPGTGIGLATVARIVGRHGGRVWAEGQPGRGATIRFTLSPEGTPTR